MASLKVNLMVAALADLALLCSSASPGLAQNRRDRNEQRQNRQQQQQHHAGDWLRRYKDLPPQQQQKALENDPQFRNLPSERQQQLRQRLQRFNNLPPQQQQRVLNRMETWEHLTPEQKQLIVELLEVIARDQVPDRPGRLEPRAVKRRPKPYERLNRRRHLMKEIPHRNHYRKSS